MSFGRFLEDEKTVREDLDELREMARRPGHLSVEQRDRLIEFPGLFRRLCHALALAKHRDYSTSVVARLNREALLSHHQMYTRSFGLAGRFGKFVTHTFPQPIALYKFLYRKRKLRL